MYSNIVVGTDGSAHALDAVRRAGELARLLMLPAVHVVSAIVPYALSSATAEFDRAGATAEQNSETDDLLATAEAALGEYDVGTVRHSVFGDPSNVVLDVADEVGAGLIVVGARGLGPLQRFLRGSVSTRIAQHAKCDVLIVEHDDREELSLAAR